MYDNPFESVMQQASQAVMGMLMVAAFIALIGYLITVFPRGKLFQLAGYPAWKAFIPFYNTYTEAKLIGRNPWLFLLLALGLPILNAFPLVGRFVWLLPILFTVWWSYELALVFGRSQRFGLVFAVVTGSAITSTLDLTWVEWLLAGPAVLADMPIFNAWGVAPFFNLAALVMVYMLAFGSKTRYRGPWADKQARLLMHSPWLYLPHEGVPTPKYVEQRIEQMYQTFNPAQQVGVQGSAQPSAHPTGQQPVAQSPGQSGVAGATAVPAAAYTAPQPGQPGMMADPYPAPPSAGLHATSPFGAGQSPMPAQQAQSFGDQEPWPTPPAPVAQPDGFGVVEQPPVTSEPADHPDTINGQPSETMSDTMPPGQEVDQPVAGEVWPWDATSEPSVDVLNNLAEDPDFVAPPFESTPSLADAGSEAPTVTDTQDPTVVSEHLDDTQPPFATPADSPLPPPPFAPPGDTPEGDDAPTVKE